MKKIATLLFVITFLFSGCYDTSHQITDSGLSVVTHGYSSLIYPSTFTDEGFYQVSSSDNGTNILYTDFNTQQQIYLCNRPECTHNNESCNSFFNTQYSNIFLTKTCDNKKIIVLATKIDEQNQVNIDVITMNPDGSERTLKSSLPYGTTVSGHIVSSKNYIYFLSHSPNSKLKKIDRNLLSINIENGNIQKLKSVDSSSSIVSANNNYIYIEKYNTDTNTCSVWRLNVNNGSYKEMLSYNRYYIADFSLPGIYDDNYLYYYDLQQDSFWKIGIENSEKILLADNFSSKYGIDRSSNIFLIDVIDNHAYIQTFKIKNGIDCSNWYNISLSDGLVKEQTLSFEHKNNHSVAYPIAEFNDHFLVIYDSVPETKVIHGTGNIYYETNSHRLVQGIISKSNFYNNSHDITPISINY